MNPQECVEIKELVGRGWRIFKVRDNYDENYSKEIRKMSSEDDNRKLHVEVKNTCYPVYGLKMR